MMKSDNNKNDNFPNSEPALRFPEFVGDWEVKKLGETLVIGSGKDYKHLREGEIPVYGTGGKISNVNGFLYDGDSVGIGRKGTIDKPVFLTGKFWTVDTLFYTHSFKNVIPYFIYLLFQKINWKKYNEASGVPSLSKSTIEKIKLNIPSLSEQTKIANFLTKLDERIHLQREIKNNLKTLIKGYRQKLFSQELRFKDENGKDFPDWVEKPLKKICDYRNGSSFENLIVENGLYNLITLNSINIKGELKKHHKKVATTDNSLKKNDLVMVLSDVAHGNFLGLVDIIPDNSYVLNQRMGALKPKTEINIYYLKSFINFNQKYFKVMGQGSSQQNLSKGDILKFTVKYPCIKEQTKIANFLSSLDKKLKTEQELLSAYEQQKKYFLQNMFV